MRRQTEAEPRGQTSRGWAQVFAECDAKIRRPTASLSMFCSILGLGYDDQMTFKITVRDDAASEDEKRVQYIRMNQIAEQ